MLNGGLMCNSRRKFLTDTSLALLGTAVATPICAGEVSQTPGQDPGKPTLPSTPGAPPAYGTGPAIGPEVTTTTFSEAEKIEQVQMSAGDLGQAANTWRVNMASLYERRTGPRKVALDATVAPFSRY